MDKPKSSVVKSKSSNSAITTKSEPRKSNKKSRSNAEFQPLVLKKRGVYVEKKPTNVSINETDIDPVVQPQAKPIPRPGRKRFLNSVLTILSQSTTGTQYPDHDDLQRLKKVDKIKTKSRKKKDEEVIQEDSFTRTSSKRKQKSKPKLSNVNSEIEQLVVLQSTKEITHTPSINSEKSHIVFPPLVKTRRNNEIYTMQHENTQELKDKIAKSVDRDPSTLVAEVPKKEEKKLYNFFVDLLETTFNVYNVKTEVHPQVASSANSSKVALEMDESVAKKLNIQKAKESRGTFDDGQGTSKTPSKYFCIQPDPNEIWDDKQLLEHFMPKSACCKRPRTVSPPQSVKRKRKLYSKSSEYKRTKTATPLDATASLSTASKRYLVRKDRKKHFLKLLKEQLKMEDDEFVEPQNFFQALKVIARNKRRCQKSIHFNQSTKKNSEGDVHVCQFRRRRLLSASTNSSGKKSNHPESHIIKSMRSFTRNSDITSSSKRRTTITITETSENEIEPSQMSLEVYGFDYDTSKNGGNDLNNVLGYHSSHSLSDPNFNGNDTILKYSGSATSSVMDTTTHTINKHGLRPINRLIGNGA